MRVLGLSLAVFALSASTAMAAPGDQWILGIHHINEIGQFQEYSATSSPPLLNAGYSGPQSSGDAQYVGKAYRRSGAHGQARVYWELSGNSIGTNRPVPSSTQQYTIEYFGTPAPGNDWQPVESQFNGAGGETYPIDSDIPWGGAFGTNHQFIGEDGRDDRAWHLIDNNGDGGPQAPTGPEFDAAENGIYMWLTAGSWLYAKWDFAFTFNRSWSAIRLTQITGPEAPDGDYNEDGFVDAADYVVWRKNNIAGATGYAAWVENFAEPIGGGGGNEFDGTSVPEPTSAALIIGGLLGAAGIAIRPRMRSSAIGR